jgi:hypothetical protein
MFSVTWGMAAHRARLGMPMDRSSRCDDVYPREWGRKGGLKCFQFSSLAIAFGLALYAATSSVVVLAADAEQPWLWWVTLVPLIISHAATGVLLLWNDARSRQGPLLVVAVAGGATVAATAVAVWLAQDVGPWMPAHVAEMILVTTSVAGVVGFGFAALRSAPRPR